MSKKYPGLYLYFDWLKGLEKMPPKTAMQIICNLYHFAEDGRAPEPLTDRHFDIIQDMYLEQIKRSKRLSEVRRASSYARFKVSDESLPYADITDPEELRQAFAADPEYKNSNIDQLVKFRMFLLNRSGNGQETTGL